MSWTLAEENEPPEVIYINPHSTGRATPTPKSMMLREFYHAVVCGDLERVQRAITPELNLDTLFGGDWDGYTALHLSVSHLDIFGFLLALGADPFSLSWPGHEQPLHTAAAGGIFEAVQVLLDMGANVNSTYAKSNVNNPLPASTALWAALHPYDKKVTGRESQDWIRTIDILAGRGAEFPVTTAVYNWLTQTYYEPEDFTPHLPLNEDTFVCTQRPSPRYALSSDLF